MLRGVILKTKLKLKGCGRRVLMPLELRSIKGIGVETEKKLNSLKINDVNMLRNQTQTPEKRVELSKKINVSPGNIYIWSKQAELMKVQGVSATDAELLVESGIRNIEDLKEVDANSLLNFISTIMSNRTDKKKIPTLEEVETWKKNAETVDSTFKEDERDMKNKYIFLDGDKKLASEEFSQSKSEDKVVKESGFFSDLSEIIIDIGTGIAGAQHEMDLSSIHIQNTIMENEELAAYGLNATWYTIPEVRFDLKMEYMIVEESTKSGTEKGMRKFFVIPSNAKYNNYFKSSKKEESNLSLRFVPLPPPEAFTERIIMPDLIGMTKEEAEEELDLNRIPIKDIEIVKGETGNENTSKVTYQSISPGKILLINEKVGLKVTLKE